MSIEVDGLYEPCSHQKDKRLASARLNLNKNIIAFLHGNRPHVLLGKFTALVLRSLHRYLCFKQQNSAADLSMLVLESLEKSEEKVDDDTLGEFNC